MQVAKAVVEAMVVVARGWDRLVDKGVNLVALAVGIAVSALPVGLAVVAV